MQYGYRKVRILLTREDWYVGKTLVCRLYQEEGLALRQHVKWRHRTICPRREFLRPHRPNEVWSLDFMADQLENRQRFLVLTVVDIYTRESLALEVGQPLKGTDVVTVLEWMRLVRRIPKPLWCDNGSEFTSQTLDLWTYHHGVRIDFSRPGKPTDNAYVESFNGTLRREYLNAHWFKTLKDAKQFIVAWGQAHNVSRPLRALQKQTPAKFAP